MMFCKAINKNSQVINHLVLEYGNNFGQHISPTMCKLYGGGSFVSRLRHIVDIHRFTVRQTLFNYLGVHIFKCRPRTHYFHIIANIVFAMLAT